MGGLGRPVRGGAGRWGDAAAEAPTSNARSCGPADLERYVARLKSRFSRTTQRSASGRPHNSALGIGARSEERRVGKECRSRVGREMSDKAQARNEKVPAGSVEGV